jgi:hypothetical protein
MPRGPNGERRPADVIGNAVQVAHVEIVRDAIARAKSFGEHEIGQGAYELSIADAKARIVADADARASRRIDR